MRGCSSSTSPSARQFRARVGGAGRIAGAVEDQEPRPRRDRRLQLGGRDLVALLRAGVRTITGSPSASTHHVGIRHPVRRRDDRLVAGVEQRQAQVVDGLLRARGDENLLGRCSREPLSRLNFAMIASLSSRDALDWPCTRVALVRSRATPASAMCIGVSKSGSPTPRPMMSWPSAKRAARAVIATVGEGLTRWTRCASRWSNGMPFRWLGRGQVRLLYLHDANRR